MALHKTLLRIVSLKFKSPKSYCLAKIEFRQKLAFVYIHVHAAQVLKYIMAFV
jgi:hypothetical protein